MEIQNLQDESASSTVLNTMNIEFSPAAYPAEVIFITVVGLFVLIDWLLALAKKRRLGQSDLHAKAVDLPSNNEQSIDSVGKIKDEQ